MADSPRRWAKVLVVDGVMAAIQHVWDDENDQYAIRCTIQTTAAEFSRALSGPKPFPQEVFDRAGEDLVRGTIAAAIEFGLEPELVSDGDTFTTLLHGAYIYAPTIQHQVQALDFALNGHSTPGVTLGMLLNQARAGAFTTGGRLADVRSGMERAAVLCEERSAGWNPDDPALGEEDAHKASGAQYEGRALAYTIREAARALALPGAASAGAVGGASHG